MDIHMITINRGPRNYIEQTVASLLHSDWNEGTLCIFVGSEDEAHLKNLPTSERIRIIHFDPQANADCSPAQVDLLNFRVQHTRPGNTRRNCGVNKATALGFGPALFCEDDVRFDPAWCAKLAEMGRTLASGSGYVLDMAKGAVLHQAPSLTGSQAVYFSTSELQEHIALSLRQYYESGRPPICSDVFIGQRALEYAELWQKRLVTHIGAFSTFAMSSTATPLVEHAPAAPHAPAASAAPEPPAAPAEANG